MKAPVQTYLYVYIHERGVLKRVEDGTDGGHVELSPPWTASCTRKPRYRYTQVGTNKVDGLPRCH